MIFHQTVTSDPVLLIFYPTSLAADLAELYIVEMEY